MAIVALLTDVALRIRVAEALRGWAAPAECVAQIRDVRTRLVAGHVRALVVAPRDACGLSTAPLVADVRREHPSITVIAYCTQCVGSSDDVVALVRAGAHTLVMRGVDDERHAFRAALRGAERQCTAGLVYDRIRDVLPPAIAPLVALYLRADGVPPSVAESAQLLGVHRKTLVNRLAAAGCPTPRALRTWCRLFVAGRLLEEPGRTVDSIAEQLKFDSATGLRNALKRYTGHGASAIRAAGGLTHVLDQFNAACAAQRPGAQQAAQRSQCGTSMACDPASRSGDTPVRRAMSDVAGDRTAPVGAGAPVADHRRARRGASGIDTATDLVTRALVFVGALTWPLVAVDELLAVAW